MQFFVGRTAGAVLLIAACAACGTATAQTQPSAAPAPASTRSTLARTDTARHGYTEADVRFMQGMIGHHAQALEMTRLVPTNTQNAGVHLVARRIDISQQDEMATMRNWLRERGEAVPAAGEHAGHDMAGMQHDTSAMRHGAMQHETMPGMASPGELARLAAARGAEFDRLFLQLMIRHHQGALVMVERLLATPGAAQDPQTFGFASDVDADQRAEIARMERMLGPASNPAP